MIIEIHLLIRLMKVQRTLKFTFPSPRVSIASERRLLTSLEKRCTERHHFCDTKDNMMKRPVLEEN